jgi:hypothetical protein
VLSDLDDTQVMGILALKSSLAGLGCGPDHRAAGE